MQHNFDALDYKILSLSEAKKRIAFWRATKDTIVFTNGCFDLLHEGHLGLLLAAAEMGSRLIVGLNSDSSVKKLKGENRPVQSQQSRARLLAAMPFVNAVIIFDEETPLSLIETILPEVLVKGGDYTIASIVGANEVIANGGKVVTVPIVAGFSTSGTIEKMK